MKAHVALSIAKTPGALTRVLGAIHHLGLGMSHYEFVDETSMERRVEFDIDVQGLTVDSVGTALARIEGVTTLRDLRPLSPGDAGQTESNGTSGLAAESRRAGFLRSKADRDIVQLVADSRAARAWLADLPLHDTEATARRVLDVVRHAGIADIPPVDWLRFLERCREAVMGVSRPAVALAVEGGLPLPKRVRSRLDAGADLNLGMAEAYARLYPLARGGPRHRRGAREREMLAQIAHRGITHYTEAARLRYTGYRDVPENLWLHVHELFGAARGDGLLDAGVTDMFASAHMYSNVLHAYKRALLFGLSNPYQCSAGEIDKVYALAEHWGSEAQLLPPGSGNGGSRFHIYPDSDLPGVSWDDAADRDGTWVTLRTRPVLRIIDEARNAAPDTDPLWRRRQAPEDDRLVLEHLLWCWRGERQRALPREPASGELTMVCGLAATVHAVSGGIADAEPVEDGSVVLAPVASTLWRAYVNDDARCVTHPLAVDDSVTGMHLALRPGEETALRVGDIVGLRREDRTDGWMVCVVRWARQLDDGEIDVGVFKVSAAAEPIAIAPAAGAPNRGAAGPAPALRIPELPAAGRARSVVSARSAYRPGAVMTLGRGPHAERIRAGRPVLMTRYVAWFEALPVD